MGTGTLRWDKVQVLGRAWEERHRAGIGTGTGIQVGPRQRDGTEYRETGRAYRPEPAKGMGTGLELTGLPIATGPPALLVGTGPWVGVVSDRLHQPVHDFIRSIVWGAGNILLGWRALGRAGVPCPCKGTSGMLDQLCPASQACLICPCHPAPTLAGAAAAGRIVRGRGQQALHALVTRFHLLLGAAGHHGRWGSSLSDARELLCLQWEEMQASRDLWAITR